ncbi:MAG: DUF4256 domain-containing protein [Firmicutes bacterium]|nr:DUF4256 domain-containing protein [Bacillota bacterium]
MTLESVRPNVVLPAPIYPIRKMRFINVTTERKDSFSLPRFNERRFREVHTCHQQVVVGSILQDADARGHGLFLVHVEACTNLRMGNLEGSAMQQAAEIGVKMMDETMYYRLQALGEFDLKTSSWIAAPDEIRKRGGALFCERRYGRVFTFHNGADSYYSVRGWRGYILI